MLPNVQDCIARMKFVNRKFNNCLQMIDRKGDTVWLGIWNNNTVDLEAVKDYLQSDTNEVSIATASQCVTFDQKVLREFSHVVRVGLKT